jgi:hypothetical protein
MTRYSFRILARERKPQADGADGAPALLILCRNPLFSAPTPWDSIANGDRNSPLKVLFYVRKYDWEIALVRKRGFTLLVACNAPPKSIHESTGK